MQSKNKENRQKTPEKYQRIIHDHLIKQCGIELGASDTKQTEFNNN